MIHNLFKDKLLKGFTLIELLVVISIIGFIASIVLVVTTSTRSKARDAKRLADIRQIKTALELYFNDNAGYPAATGSGQAAKPDPATGSPAFSTYLSIYPTYPSPVGAAPCADNTGYAYTQVTSTSYTITFCLEGASGGITSGDHTATEKGTT